MNILYITHYSGLYGANLSLLNLIIELKFNYNVKPMVLMPYGGDFETELKKNKINYEIINFKLWVNENNIFIRSFFKTIINRIKFYKIKKLIGNDYELIHSNSGVIDIGYFLSKKNNIKHIWHLREFVYEDYSLKYDMGISFASNYFNNNRGRIVAVSNSVKEKYSRFIKPQKIEVIYNGVGCKNIEPVINKNDILQFCVVGGISDKKNQIEILRAVNLLINKYNVYRFKLSIIGNGEPKFEKELLDFIKNKGIEDYVNMKGYLTHKEVLEYLLNMDVGILSSFKEAFGRVTIEYMLSKMYVIASNTGANPELIPNTDFGMLYKLGDENDLAEKMLDAITNFEKKNIVIKNSYLRAKEEFSIESNARNIYNLYKKNLVEL